LYTGFLRKIYEFLEEKGITISLIPSRVTLRKRVSRKIRRHLLMKSTFNTSKKTSGEKTPCNAAKAHSYLISQTKMKQVRKLRTLFDKI